jgi:phosphatidylglycerol:prolipoprotein diacylglycerol transferase
LHGWRHLLPGRQTGQEDPVVIDIHDRLGNSGILPSVAGFSTYSLFVGLGLAAGVLYLIWQNRRRKNALLRGAGLAQDSGHAQDADNAQLAGHALRVSVDPALIIVCAALIGGTLGAKVPTLLQGPTWQTLLINKSVVGGLLGGMASVMLVKRLLHIKLRMGNAIAPAAALGIGIGRFGCFFNGCCAGIPWIWGVDFGDGITRLPTQLFEAAFQFIAFAILHHEQKKDHAPGLLFKLYVIAYFIFRFLIEFIRVNPVYWQGMTLYQLLSLTGIAWMGLLLFRQQRLTAVTRLEEDYHGE